MNSLSLIVTVYNAVRYLEFILLALSRQTMHDFEVIIADDGSGSEIAELVERYKSSSAVPIKHIRHEDKGFRKNAILNKAVIASETDYLVFIDGDCLPHHKFLQDHWSNRALNTVLCGRRVNFSSKITDKLDYECIRSGNYEKITLYHLYDGLMARSSNLEEAIRIENIKIRRILHRNKASLLGCNFSVEKKMLESINGFNEDYKAPGLGEDSDIAYRLSLKGARFAPLRYLAVLYHLYHPRTVVGEKNKQIYGRTIASNNPICNNGLTKLLV
jgi:cellulose synthase/poly-beta-1,6-N-acetylglucosamine synthase-like glycosyltransferase